MISLGNTILNVAGITCLLIGTTLGARLPRLTRLTKWRVLAGVLFVLFAALYVVMVDAPTRCWLGFRRGAPDVTVDQAWAPTIVTLLIALGTVIFSALSWHLHAPPDWLAPLLRGARPLTVPGSVAVVALIGSRVFQEYHTDRSLWPLLLSSALFLYLWWLSIRIFDLVFIWHRYTRYAVLKRCLGDMRPQRKERERKLYQKDQEPVTN